MPEGEARTLHIKMIATLLLYTNMSPVRTSVLHRITGAFVHISFISRSSLLFKAAEGRTRDNDINIFFVMNSPQSCATAARHG